MLRYCAFVFRGSRLCDMDGSETRHARSGDVAVAYHVLAERPFDVVFAPGTLSHVELHWDAAGMAALIASIPCNTTKEAFLTDLAEREDAPTF